MDFAQMGITLVVSIIVAIVTALLSQRVFYKREVWLRKEKKYSQIIDKLSVLLKHYCDMYDDCIGVAEFGLHDEKYNTRIREVRFELERLSMMPSYIIDNEVQEVLKILFQEANQDYGNESFGDLVPYFERMIDNTRETVSRLNLIAKKDLKV